MHELMQYRNSSGITFTKMLTPLIQMPFFLSAFLGVRGMCNLPVESFQTGGLGWFTDLTIADPYCILPLIATSSILLMVYVSQVFLIFFQKAFSLRDFIFQREVSTQV
jgi:membrane protein insertase Oxa1/YidC/SpoIIIJ